ncbi:MAG: outer membrane lipoprotein chaperone LolA [Halioglobus sp.]
MRKYLAALGLLLISTMAAAETDNIDSLLDKLAPIVGLQGEFQQFQYDENDNLVAESSGHYKLLRPGYFYWEIDSPDSQLIVADPQHIWHHDRDLETVTRRPIVDSEQMSPLQVLGGNEALLRSSFTVEQTTDTTFSLHPKGINPGFQRLLVTFKGGVFEGLEIADNLNQRIVIGFTAVATTPELTPTDFAFTPPQDADLFYYDE